MKIGDFVFYNGRKCEIIADKQTPYHQLPMGDLYPSLGCDFILRQYFTEEDTANSITFLPYVHCVEQEIRLL